MNSKRRDFAIKKCGTEERSGGFLESAAIDLVIDAISLPSCICAKRRKGDLETRRPAHMVIGSESIVLQ